MFDWFRNKPEAVAGPEKAPSDLTRVYVPDGRIGVVHHLKPDGRLGVRPLDKDGCYCPNLSAHWTDEQRMLFPEEMALFPQEIKLLSTGRAPYLMQVKF